MIEHPEKFIFHIKEQNDIKEILLVLIIIVLSFSAGIFAEKISNNLSIINNSDTYDLIKTADHWELKSLHYLNLLNKCQGKE